MFDLFKRRRLLLDEDHQFQIEVYKWLLRNFGGDSFYQETLLALPIEEFTF